MNHQYIQDNQIADLYVMGRLKPDESEQFEGHFMHCTECQNEVALSANLHQAMEEAATESAPRVAERRLKFPGPADFFSRRSGRGDKDAIGGQVGWGMLNRLRPLTAIAAAMLPIALVSMFYLHQMRMDVLTPSVNTPIIVLGAVRSAAQDEPVVQFRLPEAPGWLVFSMELPVGSYPQFRVALRDGEGDSIWTGENLIPTVQGDIILSLHSSMLAPGVYTFQAEGISVDDTWNPVASFSFRAKRPAARP